MTGTADPLVTWVAIVQERIPNHTVRHVLPYIRSSVLRVCSMFKVNIVTPCAFDNFSDRSVMYGSLCGQCWPWRCPAY